MLHSIPRNTFFLKLYSVFHCSFLSSSLILLSLYALLSSVHTFSIHIHLISVAQKITHKRITPNLSSISLTYPVLFTTSPSLKIYAFTPYSYFLTEINRLKCFLLQPLMLSATLPPFLCNPGTTTLLLSVPQTSHLASPPPQPSCFSPPKCSFLGKLLKILFSSSTPALKCTLASCGLNNEFPKLVQI